jgi:hypothetical protein
MSACQQQQECRQEQRRQQQQRHQQNGSKSITAGTPTRAKATATAGNQQYGSKPTTAGTPTRAEMTATAGTPTIWQQANNSNSKIGSSKRDNLSLCQLT